MSFVKPFQMVALRQSSVSVHSNRAVPRRILLGNTHKYTKGSLPHPSSSPSFQTTIQNTTRPYSRTPSPRVISWLRDKWESSEKTKQAAKLVDQIALMADTKVWTLQLFKDEIDETLSSWKTKVPGMSGSAEIKAAKETQRATEHLVKQLGARATIRDIERMDRKDKLKLAVSCEMTMDEVNMILSQFKNMELMHRILRYRKEKGIELPTDADGLKLAMQNDGMKIMTNKEKMEMQKLAAKQQENAY